jgi:hypothetical protein
MLLELLIGLLILLLIFIRGSCLLLDVLRHGFISLSPPGKMQLLARQRNQGPLVVALLF